jgi:hypothetical protein
MIIRAIVDTAILYLNANLATEHIDLANSKTHIAMSIEIQRDYRLSLESRRPVVDHC